MTENELFVDNPLALKGLFSSGVYAVPEQKSGGYVYLGPGEKGILNIVYYDGSEVPTEALISLNKIMKAVKIGQSHMQPGDFAVINAATVMSEDRLSDIIKDFKPEKVIIWADQWFAPLKEILFYQQIRINGVDILRCHQLETVVADEDRKRECWSSVKLLFNM
jgi:hypothetical protein